MVSKVKTQHLIALQSKQTFSDDLTPIPDSGDENSLMILNGIHGETLNIESEYWSEVDYDSICKDSDGVLTGNCFDNGEKVKFLSLRVKYGGEGSRKLRVHL